jgi:hypothetical protein
MTKEEIESCLINFYKSVKFYPDKRAITKNSIIHKFLNKKKRVYLSICDNSNLKLTTINIVENLFNTNTIYLHDTLTDTELAHLIKTFLGEENEI